MKVYVVTYGIYDYSGCEEGLVSSEVIGVSSTKKEAKNICTEAYDEFVAENGHIDGFEAELVADNDDTIAWKAAGFEHFCDITEHDLT